MDDVVFYTVPEAAARLQVSKNWLYSQLAQKRFLHRKVGNRYEMSDEHIALAHAELEVHPEPAVEKDPLSAASVSRRRSA